MNRKFPNLKVMRWCKWKLWNINRKNFSTDIISQSHQSTKQLTTIFKSCSDRNKFIFNSLALIQNSSKNFENHTKKISLSIRNHFCSSTQTHINSSLFMENYFTVINFQPKWLIKIVNLVWKYYQTLIKHLWLGNNRSKVDFKRQNYYKHWRKSKRINRKIQIEKITRRFTARNEKSRVFDFLGDFKILNLRFCLWLTSLASDFEKL